MNSQNNDWLNTFTKPVTLSFNLFEALTVHKLLNDFEEKAKQCACPNCLVRVGAIREVKDAVLKRIKANNITDSEIKLVQEMAPKLGKEQKNRSAREN